MKTKKTPIQKILSITENIAAIGLSLSGLFLMASNYTQGLIVFLTGITISPFVRTTLRNNLKSAYPLLYNSFVVIIITSLSISVFGKATHPTQQQSKVTREPIQVQKVIATGKSTSAVAGIQDSVQNANTTKAGDNAISQYGQNVEKSVEQIADADLIDAATDSIIQQPDTSEIEQVVTEEINKIAEQFITPLFPTQENDSLYTVLNVIDSNAIEVNAVGKINLLGVTSFVDYEPSIQECRKKLSHQFLSNLLIGSKVKLEYDKNSTNQNSITQAYIMREDGLNVNYEIIAKGFGLSEYGLQHTNSYSFNSAQDSAQRQRLGLWNTQTCLPEIESYVTPAPIKFIETNNDIV